MIDREKVIKALECCSNDKPFYHAHCDKCPYNGRNPDNMGGCIKLYRDALELLKGQENCVCVPFTWLVKFCTHLDFHEPMSDEERAVLWKKKLNEQLWYW